MTTEHVAFVGLGYIGLPTAVIMANNGIKVTGVDVDTDKVTAINRGETTIVEPGLERALSDAIESGNFSATTEMPVADTYIIAVPTPFTSDHNVDMRFIYSAVEAIAQKLKGGELIILESTSPPRTTEKMADRVFELRPELFRGSPEDDLVLFAHCPERILPGRALEELRTNDRIVGGRSPEATARAAKIYGSFCDGELLETDDRTAELAKLTENAFRDVNIAFANELSVVCEDLGVDVWKLIELANHHPRVNILQPGPGVGGHCIAVDPWFIVSAAPEVTPLIRTAREVNDAKPSRVISAVNEALADQESPVLCLLGLAFKPNIDDLRESPALSIAHDLAAEHADVPIHIVEPHINELPGSLAQAGNVRLTTLEEGLLASNVVALLVDHDQFLAVDRSLLAEHSVIDTRGAWSTKE